MYRAGHKPKSKRRRAMKWLLILALIAGLSLLVVDLVRRWYKPQTVIQQAPAAKVQQVSYAAKTQTFSEPDFTIQLPKTWTAQPRPPHTYNSFTWQGPERVTDGEIITVYEDTIPVNFAVNRVLIVSSIGDQVQLQGSASDNCANFTKTGATTGSGGVHAKWQGVDFLCDLGNQERDVIGTSSTDGINTVILKSPLTGQYHKFFFTYTDFATNPDYSTFYSALQSFRLQ